MIAKYLKRLVGSVAIAALTIALAYPAFAQTTYKTETSVNVGQTSSNTQLSRDEINQQELHDELEENTHHDGIEQGLNSQGRADAISHELRLKQLEAAQTPYKPQHIADENEQYADEKKDNAQKQAIEAQRHAQALVRIEAAAQALLSGAASALGNAANGGGGSPSGSAPQPNSGGSASNPSGGGSAGNPNGGGRSAGNPNSGGSASNPSTGGGSPGNRAYPGGAPGGVPSNPALGGNGSPGNPNNGGGTASNPNTGGGSASNPNGGGGSPGNQNASGGSPGSPRLAGGASSNANGAPNSSSNPNNGGSTAGNPNNGGGSASNPNGGGGSPNNPNAGGGSPRNPRLTGNASSNPSAGNSSPNNPYRGSASASNPNSGGGSASNPNAGRGSANNPRLTGNASSNANASSASSSGPGAGQRPLDFIPKALNGFVDQFQNGGQNLQNAANALHGVAQELEKDWTEPNGGIKQVAWAAAGGIAGKGLKLLGPAIKGVAGKAAAAAPAAAAKAAAAATGFLARARAALSRTFGRLTGAAESNTPGALSEAEQAAKNGANAINPAENPAPQTLKGGATAAGENPGNAGEPAAGKPGENPSKAGETGPEQAGTPEDPITGKAVSNDWQTLAGKVVKIGPETFDLGANRGAGTFGAVYDVKDTPKSLLKVVRNDLGKSNGIDRGAKSIQGQLAGTKLLQKAGIATPAIKDISSGETNALVTEDVTKAFNRGFVPDLSKPLNGAQRAAVQRMFNQLGDEGLVWEDGGLRNVFFYTADNGSLSAGILDSDRLFPVSELEAQSDRLQRTLLIRTLSHLEAAGVDLRNITAKNYMDALFKVYYPG